MPVEKTLEQIGKALIDCGKAAADANVEIWVEVHGGGTAHPPRMKTIMGQCGHPAVGVTWNSNRDDIKDGSVAEYFKLLRPWIRSCHINDLYKDATGGYPYRELFRLLRQTGYDRLTRQPELSPHLRECLVRGPGAEPCGTDDVAHDGTAVDPCQRFLQGSTDGRHGRSDAPRHRVPAPAARYFQSPSLARAASMRSRAFFGSLPVLIASRLAGTSPTTTTPTMPIPTCGMHLTP